MALEQTRPVSTAPADEVDMRQTFTGFLSLSFLLGTASLLQSTARCQTAPEQNPKKLALRGNVTAVEIMDDSANSGTALIIVWLELNMVNTGTRPLIFLSMPPLFHGAALARTPEEFSVEDWVRSELTYDFGGPSISKDPKWAVMRARLDQPAPPPDLTRILSPGGSWKLATRVVVGVPTDRVRQNLLGKKEPLQAFLDASPVWIQVLGDPWPPDLWDTNKYKVGFGKELQQRWMDKGLLWYELLRSEPMLLDLKKAKHTVLPRNKN